MNDQEIFDVKRLINDINHFNSMKISNHLNDEHTYDLKSVEFWLKLFNNYFLVEESSFNDDLLFFVRKSSRLKFSTEIKPTLEVFRKNSKKLPLGDLDVNWEETLYINIIMQLFEYKLTFAICTRTSLKEFQILAKDCQQVYASPSYRSMSNKAIMDQLTYPDIFFTINNYEELMCKFPLRNGEMICVELAASDRNGNPPVVLFFGTVSYETIELVESKFKLKTSKKISQTQLLRMKGPQNKGMSEMAIQKRPTDLNESTSLIGCKVVDFENKEMIVDVKRRRKMFNLFLFCCCSSTQKNFFSQKKISNRSDIFDKSIKAWGTKPIHKSKSANEVYNIDDYQEIEASDIEDEYNQDNLWKIPGFSQSFQIWKAKKRVNSQIFHVFTTYIALPLHFIIKDLLNSKQHSILTF